MPESETETFTKEIIVFIPIAVHNSSQTLFGKAV
jgi:hypothetical protein